MIDIECHFTALKTSRISRIVNSGQQAWAFLGRHYLSKFGKRKYYTKNIIFMIQKKGNKTETLILRNWIEVNMLKSGEICFVNGNKDEKYIFDTLIRKQNYIQKICFIKKPEYQIKIV